MEISTPERFYTNLTFLIKYILDQIPEDNGEHIFVEITLLTLKKWDYEKKKESIVKFINSTFEFWNNSNMFHDLSDETSNKYFINNIKEYFSFLEKY